MFRVKICGVTRPPDASAAASLGADAVGINFFRKSLRYIPPGEAGPIVRAAREGGAVPVGVFVDEDPGVVEAVCRSLGIDVAQLSGDEPPGDAARIGVRRIKAIRIDGPEGASPYLSYPCDAFLLDAAVPGEFGGTGRILPWDRFAPMRLDRPWILAGGLTPENVAEAVRRARPDGVDVASGVESSPGIKDIGKMETFIRSASRALGAAGGSA